MGGLRAGPTLPQASKATTLTATCPCHLFFRGFKTAVCPPSNPPNASNAPAGLQGNNSYSYMSPNPPNASNPLAGLPGPAICFSGVQDCRLPALKPPKRFQRSRRPPRQQLLQLHVLKPGPDRCLFSSGKLCGYCVPTAAWALHVSRALRYHACAFEANDASAADCGLSRQSLATFGTNKA